LTLTFLSVHSKNIKEHICDDEDVNVLSRSQKNRTHVRACHVEYTGDLIHLDDTMDNTNAKAADDVISQASVEYEPADIVEKKKRSASASLSKRQLYFKRYLRFINSPRVIFFYEIFFFSIYLLLFSYWLLVKFNYYEIGDMSASGGGGGNVSDVFQQDPDGPDMDDDEDDDEDMGSPMVVGNRTHHTTLATPATLSRSSDVKTTVASQVIRHLKKRKKFIPGKRVKIMMPPVFIEYLLVYWVVMFFIEEISQVYRRRII
jgi:hypothetical protein